MKGFSILMLLCATSVVGCAAPSSPGVPAQQATLAPNSVRQARTRSWMAPEAKRGDLLYVTNAASRAVTVYSYPKVKLVGTLTDLNDPYGVCADNSGNVYVSDYSDGYVAEYAHGGTTQIAKLKDSEYLPQGCSIDPTTANLGLANYETAWDYPGNLSVYRKARRFPRAYIVYDFYYYLFDGYDAGGNLYVDGEFSSEGENFEFAQLAKGSNTLKQMRLPVNIGAPGGIAWDGNNLAVADASSDTVYAFAIAKGGATLKTTTPLSGAEFVGQFAIDGSTLVAPNYFNSGSNVLFYSYPAGGSPTLTITDGVDYPRAVAISLAGARTR